MSIRIAIATLTYKIATALISAIIATTQAQNYQSKVKAHYIFQKRKDQFVHKF